MLSKHFQSVLATDLPVLFAYIGWTNEYNGTEPVRGSHGYLRAHPEDRDTTEARAFLGDGGIYQCGIGRGNGPSRLHVVFVARDPISRAMKVVGLYAGAKLECGSDWADAQTRTAALIPIDRRPKVTVKWPKGQGIRRWASRESGQAHPSLLTYFDHLKPELPFIFGSRLPSSDVLDQTYSGLEAREGKQRKALVIHRSRETRLRRAKIEQTLDSKNGRLACEVPGCGFDFLERYGDLGFGYAHVHHLAPLASINKKGKKTSVADLAIVCANCHAMIHYGGECRELTSLIPKAYKRA